MAVEVSSIVLTHPALLQRGKATTLERLLDFSKYYCEAPEMVNTKILFRAFTRYAYIRMGEVWQLLAFNLQLALQRIDFILQVCQLSLEVFALSNQLLPFFSL